MSGLSTPFQLAFQVSPIILTGGLAGAIPGGMLPIVSILEAINFPIGLLGGGTDASLDDFFAQFIPLPGSTLIETQYGHYPFANQTVAANAAIAQPLHLSMLMISPVREPLGYAAKLAVMSALKATLAQHRDSGGSYTVATPACIFTNGLLLTVKDVSGGDTKQLQHTWQWDFEFPLITQDQAQQTQNTLMQKLTNGLPTDGATSGPGNVIGIPPSGAAPSLIPATQSLSGASAAGPFMLGGSPVS